MLHKHAMRACVIVVIFQIASSIAQRSSYGEACNKTVRCDRRSWLSCFSEKCDCVKPDEMVFEPSTGKCASKAGERCKYALEHSDGSKSFEYTNCVKNSSCGEDGFCACNEDFHEKSNGTCTPNGRHSDPCNEQSICSSIFGLACTNGTCQCQDKVSLYSDAEAQCVGLVGHLCVASKCTENARCSSKKCVCDKDYYHNSEDKCSMKKGLLDGCTDDDQCKYEGGMVLKCLEGACVCDPSISIHGTAKRHKKREEYSCRNYGNVYLGFEHESKTQCLGKAGLRCIDGLCAVGSYCRHDSCSITNFNGTCTCLSGYSQSTYGTCGVGYDQSCGTAGVCFNGMACSTKNSNKCRCRYSNQNYDSSLRKCISPVGGACDDNSSCKNGAICQHFENSRQGTCQCKPGHIEDPSGACFADFGMSCSTASTCDVTSGLECIEYACQCGGFQEYSPSLQKCVGLVGAKCNLKSENECAENARCLKIREGFTNGRCKCSTGFTASNNYTCIVAATEALPLLAFPLADDDDASSET